MRFVATRRIPQDRSRIESSGGIERVEFEAPDKEAALVHCFNHRLNYIGPMVVPPPSPPEDADG